MLYREVYLELPLPYKWISEYRSRHGIGGEGATAGGVGKKKDTLQNKEDVLLCRGLLDEVRTFFEQKFCLQAENSDRKK
jgi:hypothetical protein